MEHYLNILKSYYMWANDLFKAGGHVLDLRQELTFDNQNHKVWGRLDVVLDSYDKRSKSWSGDVELYIFGQDKDNMYEQEVLAQFWLDAVWNSGQDYGAHIDIVDCDDSTKPKIGCGVFTAEPRVMNYTTSNGQYTLPAKYVPSPIKVSF